MFQKKILKQILYSTKKFLVKVDGKFDILNCPEPVMFCSKRSSDQINTITKFRPFPFKSYFNIIVKLTRFTN